MILSKLYENKGENGRVTARRTVMLLRFEVSNHRSILEPVELSMIAVDEDRPAARSFELLNERVLTVAGIYGPNASGKSNLLDALAWLSSAVGSSLRAWDEEVPWDPHRFQSGPNSISTFEVDIMVDRVRHQYRLELDTEVRYESLHSYPKRRRRMLFEREGLDIHFREGYEATGGIRELLTPTTLGLSAAMRLDHSIQGRVGRALAEMQVFGLRRPGRQIPYGSPYWQRSSSMRRFAADYNQATLPLPGFDERPLPLLQLADPSIDTVEFAEARDDDRALSRRIRFVRSVDEKAVGFGLDQESAGTKTWFHLIGPVLGALQHGGILLHDEIDASLHPQLSAQLIGLFHDPETNPHGAQLIFTTHDVSLLNHLNRDEVWLTEKDSDGMTQLVALAEYRGDRVRKSVNLERAYMQGRFGAVPDVDQFAVRYALGLAGRGS